jgi:hypothetical protein
MLSELEIKLEYANAMVALAATMRRCKVPEAQIEAVQRSGARSVVSFSHHLSTQDISDLMAALVWARAFETVLLGPSERDLDLLARLSGRPFETRRT